MSTEPGIGPQFQTCEVCGRTAADVEWVRKPLAPRHRWLCTNEAACFDAYRERERTGRRA